VQDKWSNGRVGCVTKEIIIIIIIIIIIYFFSTVAVEQ